MTKRSSARRAATFLAVLGALIMSSGLALMASAGSASATENQKVVVCKYVSTPGGELDHIVIVGDDTLPDGFTGSFPFKWTDAQGQSTKGSVAVRYAKDGEQAKDVAVSDCPTGETPPPPVCPEGTDHAGEQIPPGETAESFCNDEVPPPATCPEGTDKAGQEIPEGSTAEEFCTDVVSPPAVCPEGTDNAGQQIPAGQTADAFCDDTVVVSPPVTVVVNTPKVKHHAAAVTPTVVHAGLTSVSADDMRGEQGLALMFAGMLMLVAAGGLGLRVRGAASRI